MEYCKEFKECTKDGAGADGCFAKRCFEGCSKTKKPEAVLSNSTDWLARLGGCLKEVSTILAEAEKDGNNQMLAYNLDEAEAYLTVAIGYLDA